LVRRKMGEIVVSLHSVPSEMLQNSCDMERVL